jgi:hypothetical protein
MNYLPGWRLGYILQASIIVDYIIVACPLLYSLVKHPGGMNMSTNAINSYTLLNALYGKDINLADPLLAPDKSSTESDIFSYQAAADDNSSSLFSDSVNVSQTAEFFSKLQEIEKTDPDKYKEIIAGLGEKLKSARGFEGEVFSGLVQGVANGKDLAQLLTQSSFSTDLYTAAGNYASNNSIKQVISKIMEKLNEAASDTTASS